MSVSTQEEETTESWRDRIIQNEQADEFKSEQTEITERRTAFGLPSFPSFSSVQSG